MRNAALILGLIGGIVGMIVGFFGYGFAVLGEIWAEFFQAAQEVGVGEVVEDPLTTKIIALGAPILAIAGAVELVGASLESLLVSAGKAHTAFIVRAVPTVLALVLLDTAIDWNGAKGAAFAVLGSSSLAVIGFYVAILNLQQIRIRIDPPSDGEMPQPEGATNTPAPQRD